MTLTPEQRKTIADRPPEVRRSLMFVTGCTSDAEAFRWPCYGPRLQEVPPRWWLLKMLVIHHGLRYCKFGKWTFPLDGQMWKPPAA